MIVDAHQHLWQIGRNGHEWPTPDLPAIHRDFVTADLEAVASACGVTATVLVQSQPSDLDTDWMLAVAAQSPLVRGVVGWVDMLSPAAPARIAELARHPKFRSVRPMLQGLDDDWILQDAAYPAIATLFDTRLRFDALVYTRHLPAIDRLAERNPGLPIVVDHGAKPPIAHPAESSAWYDAIARIAERPNVCCKLSGLWTETADTQPLDVIKPYADHLLAVFGPERLMWGSDWPVVLLKDSYRAWFDWTVSWLADKPAATRDAIMGGTASRFYALD